MVIRPLTHVRQEQLIRKRIELMNPEQDIKDGFVDQVENEVNAVITDKVIPRFPFYILSVIQTFEGFMPNNLNITSYGHCYYVLIFTRLMKAGIANRDEDINVCLNLLEHLAFRIYKYVELHGQDFTRAKFDVFITEYRCSYIIRNSIINRLKDPEYGILSDDGHFHVPYMYYFFLGMFLAKSGKQHKEVVERMCKYSHVSTNHLTLLFTIHHATDNEIIDTILLWTMCTLDNVQPVNLSHRETTKFYEIVAALSSDILSDDDVRAERKKERRFRDLGESFENNVYNNKTPKSEIDETNDLYRILKNNKILGQVLRNKYGNLRKEEIAEIIEIIADGGLRLVNSILGNEDEIEEYAYYIKMSDPTKNMKEVRWMLRRLSFLWTMINIENVVSTISHRAIMDVVKEVVRNKSTPAYDLIGYFSILDNAEDLTDLIRQKLADLLRKHNDPFIKGVLTIRTLHYMNTHSSKATIEQQICSLLDIQYRHRFRQR